MTFNQAFRSLTSPLFLLSLSIVVGSLSMLASKAEAQIPEGLRVAEVSIYGKDDEGADIGLGERLAVEITHPDGEIANTEKFKFESLILYLDERPLADHHPKPCLDPASGQCEGDKAILLFELKRDHSKKESRDVWSSLLGSPLSLNRTVSVGVGLPTGERIPIESGVSTDINLEMLGGTLLTTAIVIFFLSLILFLWCCERSDIIRQKRRVGIPTGERPPYSLGKTQMAWWFFLVLGSYLFISVATLNYETISAQALVLIGIAAGTGLGAIAIDSGKDDNDNVELTNAQVALKNLDGRLRELEDERNTLKAIASPDATQAARLAVLAGEIAEIPEKQRELSETIKKFQDTQSGTGSKNFFIDLVSDGASVSFHRFQNVVWSVVLGMVFLFQVWQGLAMPEFSATLLALMGITSGTYLGFKFPEKPK